MNQLYEKLRQNYASGIYPYHMPGHKRNMAGFPMEASYQIDITEIDGFDNLHQPSGILKELMERAGKLFGAETYLLVNGSTGGILSAVSAAVKKGETLLMARNCHKSAYHAAYLHECRIEYCYPPLLEEYGICGGISPESIKKKLEEKKEIRAVFLTSPTYDGVISDIRGIVREAHKRDVPVIVDEAHGAHFGLAEGLPESAVDCGADLVIHSIHKTLPAFTQTALLHVQGNRIDRERLKRFLQIYQTSSPSYLLLAGIEECISLLEKDREDLYRRFWEQQEVFEKSIRNLKNIKVLSAHNAPKEVFDFDSGKKIISVKGLGISGQELLGLLLKRYGLQMEMAGWDYVTAIMTVMDVPEGYERLAQALKELDGELACRNRQRHGIEKVQPRRMPIKSMGEVLHQEEVYPISVAWEKKTGEISLEACAGFISAGFVHIYPPGIPMIVPGERFQNETVRQLLSYREQGFTIEGLHEENKKAVIIQEEKK